MRRTSILVCLVAIVGMTVVPAEAGKKKRKVKTTVTIEQFVPARQAQALVDVRFLGTADAKKKKCERKRKIVLFKTFGGTTQKVGTGKTDRNGEWGITVPLAVHNFEGEYTAKGKKRKTRKFKCKKDTSNVFTFDS